MSDRTFRGFTLVELMVVIAVIGMILGFGAPALLKSLPGFRVSGAARGVLADFREARTLAVEKGVPVVVKFHVDGSGSASTGRYVLAMDDNDDGDFSASDDTLVKVIDLPGTYESIAFNSSATSTSDGVELAAGVDNAVTFNSNGSSSESGEIYLMPSQDVGGRTDRNRRVRIVSSTGNVRVENYEGGSWQ